MRFIRVHEGFFLWALCLLLAGLLVACSDDGGTEPEPESDGDEDYDWDPYPTDGDRQPPDTLPEPEGEPALDFRFGEEHNSLVDWQVVDVARERDGASDWRIVPDGLTQRANLGATRSPRPEPANSHLVSTDLRYSRRHAQVDFVELRLSPGQLKGGFGVSLENGLSEVLLCPNEDACGGRFVRWNQSGFVRGLSPVGDYSGRETLTLRLAVVSGFGMVMLDDDLLLTVEVEPLVRGRVGILLYLQDDPLVHSLRVWGELGPELYRQSLGVKVVSLRGFGASEADSLHPENTLAAVRQALSVGVDAVLVDLRLTADGVPVLLHDATLDRTTNCTGPVVERDSATLADCVVTGGAPGETLRVPTLDALLQSISRATLWLQLYGSGDEVVNRAAVRAILERIDAHRALERVALVSDELEILRYARVESPGLDVFWRVEVAGDTVLQLAADNAIRGVLVSDEALTVMDVEAGHTLGRWLGAWGVNTVAAMQGWREAGADVLLTDRPDLAVGLGWQP